ncbi:MAG: flavodoxin family protein [Gammaproteobacteria bacterium]|nr:flavodoxin family protein [Gammaproteobacteria bacterium]
MSNKKKLLIIAHAPSENTQHLRDAVLKGATHIDIENVAVVMRAPLDTQPADIIAADAIILGTTENFGYMAGLVKDVFDRCFYPCLEHTEGMPFAFYVRAGLDGTGTCTAIKSITKGLRWKLVQEPLLCKGSWDDAFLAQCEELGLSMAAGLEAGIF